MNRYARQQMAPVPQSQPLPGMVQNAAGGYAFKAPTMVRLRRFLVLGTEGGSYYNSETALTAQNLRAVDDALALDGRAAVEMIVEVSERGLNIKQDTVLYALARASLSSDLHVRRQVYASLPKVCRTASQLMSFIQAAKSMGRTSSRGLRQAISRWYASRNINDLSYQMIKYRNRAGWSHRDILRYAHPHPDSKELETLFAWAVGKDVNEDQLPNLVQAFLLAQRETDQDTLIDVVMDFNLPHEAIPPKWLTVPAVWEALLQKMPATALLRNLARMTAIGLLAPFAEANKVAVARLTDPKLIQSGRVHPISVLKARKLYEQGHGEKGSLTWIPVPAVIAALEQAFEVAFVNVDPIAENILIALDSSGSMSGWGSVMGVNGLKPLEAAAALAKVYLTAQPEAHLIAFDTDYRELSFTGKSSLGEIFSRLAQYRGGGTDTAFPFRYAQQNHLPVDGVLLVTDGESWAGYRHTTVEFDLLRRDRPNLRVVNVQTAASQTQLFPENHPEVMEIPGFGADTVQVTNLFLHHDL